ncbi:fungal-specific transcription factor domain-containing protein [Cubamyces lactineus]|nr:fungal-specific transcription factor domain-containing protein [Cubamyces lactineus]
MPAGEALRSVIPPLSADRSDDDDPSPPPVASSSTSGQTASKTQRSAKACDRCRKSKSKCEPSAAEGEPCKACAALGAECAYTTPSFRRGPPKGYIQALEHRLHQVESVLAAIMSSTDIRSRSVIDELRKDELAAHILETVDAGPFGISGRQKRAIDTTKDNFFSSIVSDKPRAQSHRSRRESRATRENVIENVIARDPQIQTTRPTLAWQDKLSERLARSFGGIPSSPSTSMRSSMQRDIQIDTQAAEDAVHLVSPYGPQREGFPSGSQAAGDDDDLQDCADAFGNLSIDENREVRYHGNASGLQLLALADRTDGRNIQGIWNFPMGRVWPGPVQGGQQFLDSVPARSLETLVRLPPAHVRERLLEVYFAYVNPAVPVVDEEAFRMEYEMMIAGSAPGGNARDSSYPQGNTASTSTATTSNTPTCADEPALRPEHPQKLTNLLLFAIFAVAASYVDRLPHRGPGGIVEGVSGEDESGATATATAADYAACARRILDTVYHESRSATVQALVLLGTREFGIGSLEEGWLHIGMAIRMALDLGLNRNPEKWTHNGRQLFTPKEMDIRKRIWWACCIADKFSALFLGRTIAIHETDFSTPLLEVPPDDLETLWRQSPIDPRYGTVPPAPAAYVSYLRHASSLYIIIGEILAKVYRVSRAHVVPSRDVRQTLYARLMQWSLELPDCLTCSASAAGTGARAKAGSSPGTRTCPPPHVLALHMQYWASVLLLHRPFIPKGEQLARQDSPSLDPDSVPWESYDICQGAASQLASVAMLYHEKYDMRWAPPFLASCLQAAGIMHIVTLKYKPLDTQASVGLQRCIAALAGMEATWPFALRVRHLIQNAKVNIDQAHASATTARRGAGRRQKRPAQVAFEYDQAYDGPTVPSQASVPPVAQRAPSSIPSSSAIPPVHHPSIPAVVPTPARHPSRAPSAHAQLHPHPMHVAPPSRAQTQHAAVQAYPALQPHQQPYPHQHHQPHPQPQSHHDAAPFTGYVTPGYDSWWPVMEQQPDDVGVAGAHVPGPLPPGASGVTAPGSTGVVHAIAPAGGDGAGMAPGLPSQEFTFDQQHFSPEFLQAMRDPMLHFPSVFAHQY